MFRFNFIHFSKLFLVLISIYLYISISSIHRYMVETYKFIDETRTAASGVSYGGYVVGMMLAKSKEDGMAPIHCGVAISPVVEWRYYGR